MISFLHPYILIIMSRRRKRMPKQYRGKEVQRTAGWRGTCPICHRMGVKLLWKKGDQMVCKRCAKIK